MEYVKDSETEFGFSSFLLYLCISSRREARWKHWASRFFVLLPQKRGQDSFFLSLLLFFQSLLWLSEMLSASPEKGRNRLPWSVLRLLKVNLS